MKREVIQAGAEPSPIAAYLSDAIRVSPFVFASGILVPTEPTTDPYHSPIRVQTDLVFKRLDKALQAGGSLLAESVRLGAYLSRLDDLYNYIELSRDYQGSDAPAALIGCGLVRANAVVEVDSIGIIPGPGVKRDVFSTGAPGVLRSAQAVRAGPFIFTSSVTGTSGTPPPEALPYFGSRIKQQTKVALDALRSLLELGGADLHDVVRVQVVLADVSDFFAFDEVWRSYFPSDPPARSTFRAGLADPDCLVAIDAIAIAPASGLTKQTIRTERVRPAPTAESQAVRAGDFVFVGGLLPTDYDTGLAPQVRIDRRRPHEESAIKKQVSYVLSNLDEILKASGSSRRSVVKVGAYHSHLSRDLLGAMQVRREFFGDGPPASTTIEVPELLVPGSLFMFDAIAVVESP
jgi:enamine deaminase RidA (YjgF/YER057c/UK114 family)